jgi:hypothetical protein
MKFAKAVYLIAGIYGLIITAPLYFFEAQIGRDMPPAITHPEYFYGFLGAVLAWQVVFLIISRDPIRYRPLMLATLIEKFSYAIAVPILFSQGRVTGTILAFALIDLLLGILFVLAYVRTGEGATQSTPASRTFAPDGQRK